MNARIGDLSRCVVSWLHLAGNELTIRFDPTDGSGGVFYVRLGGLVGFIDRGLVSRPLTAGLVWSIDSPFGRENSMPVGRKSLRGLVELRLDYEDDEGLHCRFQAVSREAAAWNGTDDRA